MRVVLACSFLLVYLVLASSPAAQAQGKTPKAPQKPVAQLNPKVAEWDKLYEQGDALRAKGDAKAAESIFQKCLELAGELRDDKRIANSLSRLGSAYDTLGQFEKALDFHTRALAGCEKLRDERGVAIPLNNIGVVYRQLGQFEKALDFFTRSLAIKEKTGDQQGIARSLNNIGAAHSSLGQFDKALDFCSRALSIREKLGNQQEIATSLNNIGLIYKQLGQLEKALDFYSRSLPIREKLGNQREIATTLNSIGDAHYSLGQFEKALDFYPRSLAIREKLGNQREIAISLDNIGLVHFSLGRFDKALDFLTGALEISEKLGNQVDTAAYFSNIGNVYYSLGQFDKALGFYNRGLAISEKLGNQQDISAKLNNIGAVYDSLGQFDKALGFFNRALEIREKVGNQQDIAGSLNNVGGVYLSLGQFDKALDFRTRGLEISEKLGNQQDTAAYLNNIGAVYYSLGQFDKALGFFNRALEIREKVGNQQDIGASLDNIGAVNISLGQFDKALGFLNRALEIREKVGNQQDISGSLSNIGAVHYSLGQFDQALDFHNRALEIREKIGNQRNIADGITNIGSVYVSLSQFDKALDFHNRALVINEKLGNQQFMAMSLQNIGTVYVSLGLYGQAGDAYLKAMRGFEGLSLQVGDASEVGSFQAAHQGSLYARYAALENKQGHALEALALSERGRAQGLSRQIGLLETTLGSILGPEDARNLEQAQAEVTIATKTLRSIAERLQTANDAMKPLLQKAEDEERKKLSKAESKYGLVKDSLLAKNEAFRAICARAEDSGSGQRLLQVGAHNPDTLFIEYSLRDDRALVFILAGKGSLKSLEFPLNLKGLKKTVADYIAAVENSEADELRLAKQLYTMVLAPLEKEGMFSKRVERIAIVAEGPLLEIPFAALANDKGRRLIERYAVSNLVSISTLLWNIHREPTLNMLAIADTTGSGGEVLQTATRGGFAPLPEARKEGVRAWKAFPDSTCYIGNECKESVIKQEMTKYSLLHFACHGSVNSKLPMRSALAMAPESSDSNEDGFLEAQEIVGLPLSAQLAVLSACHTGEGLQSGGEGLMGLAWAFRAAGVPAVVASKWEVDDAATGRIMQTFYEELKKGSRKDDALRTAMLKEMHYPETSGHSRNATALGNNPGKKSNAYYWAAFQVIGDCKPLAPLPKR